MRIRNIETKKEYTLPRSEWDKMEKNQKLFKVIDESDEEEKKPQIIDNTMKPHTGNKDVIIKDEKNKQTKKK